MTYVLARGHFKTHIGAGHQAGLGTSSRGSVLSREVGGDGNWNALPLQASTVAEQRTLSTWGMGKEGNPSSTRAGLRGLTWGRAGPVHFGSLHLHSMQEIALFLLAAPLIPASSVQGGQV